MPTIKYKGPPRISDWRKTLLYPDSEITPDGLMTHCTNELLHGHDETTTVPWPEVLLRVAEAAASSPAMQADLRAMVASFAQI